MAWRRGGLHSVRKLRGLGAGVVLLSSVATAQSTTNPDPDERARDAEIFGAFQDETGDTAPPASREPPGASREDAIFGSPEAPEAPPEADRPFASEEEPGTLERLVAALGEADDPLALGGFAFFRVDYFAAEEGAAESFPLISPNFVDLYLDGRPTERLRFYLRGRLRHRLTSGASSLGSLGATGEDTEVQLDQMWLKFDIAQRVYVTFGQQRVRWGSGRIWNPTDFLNAQILDPLALFDERLGVGLLRLHWPVESLGWNFYAVALLDDVAAPRDVGAALRAEFLVGPSEVALSGSTRREQPWRLGLDVTTAVGDFDLRAETALQYAVPTPRFRGDLNLEQLIEDPLGVDPARDLPQAVVREDAWYAQVMLGAEIAVQYSDEDAVVLGAEYFYNQLGYRSPDLRFLALSGNLRPLYTGRHYGALYAVLIAPGSWNDSTFLVNVIGNLSDRSFIGRLDYQITVLTRLSLNVYGSAHFGERGEFRFGFEVPPLGDALALLPEGFEDLLPPALQGVNLDAFAQGIAVPAPLLEVGVGARLTF